MSFSQDDVITLTAYASCTENQDALDACVTGSISDPACARAIIKLLSSKPFNAFTLSPLLLSPYLIGFMSLLVIVISLCKPG